jgi:hypothetical protein
MKRLSPAVALPLLVAASGCAPIFEMSAPIAYVGACPFGDHACQRNADAQTLAYIGQPEAALRLMCLDADLAETMREECDLSFALY